MEHGAYIREVPGGAGAVVCIHGVCGTPRHFDDLVACVPPDWSVYNLCLAGHGSDVRAFSRATMEQWREQVDTLLCRLQARHRRIFVAAHSMGTLFALEAAGKYSHVEQLFLLSVPLRIRLKPSAALHALQLVFLRGTSPKPLLAAMQRTCGIKLNRRLWQYLGWLPNYAALLRRSRAMREVIRQVTTPCLAFHGARDELVAASSRRYFPAHFRYCVLPESGHFDYAPKDYQVILEEFSKLFLCPSQYNGS